MQDCTLPFSRNGCRELHPQSCESSAVSSTGPLSQISWGFSVPLPDLHVGKSVVGPRIILTTQEFIWYNCSAVCGLSAWWLYGVVDGGAWCAAVHGVAKSQTRLSNFIFTFHFHSLEKEMQPTPVFLPGESQGWRSLLGCHLWGDTESDMTDVT